jgi:hypothetical protein
MSLNNRVQIAFHSFGCGPAPSLVNQVTPPPLPPGALYLSAIGISFPVAPLYCPRMTIQTVSTSASQRKWQDLTITDLLILRLLKRTLIVLRALAQELLLDEVDTYRPHQPRIIAVGVQERKRNPCQDRPPSSRSAHRRRELR